jgi:Protein of unknown function (DUF3099)
VVDVTPARGSDGTGPRGRFGGRRGRRQETVYQITAARRGVRDDVNTRTRRYLYSMGVRTACFIGAVVVGAGWLRWVLIVGAVVLPYFSVVFANGGRERMSESPLTEHYEDRKAITGRRITGRET